MQKVEFFHSSAVLQKGRRTGAQAVDSVSRDYSKKHKKRKTQKEARVREKEEIRSKGHDKLKSEGIKTELASSEIQDYIRKMTDR